MAQALIIVAVAILGVARLSGALHLTPDSYAPCTYTPSGPVRILDCSSKGLTAVPGVDPAMAVSVFYLDGNAIPTIGPSAFSNLSATLTLLSIKSTVPMDRIDSAALAGLATLKSLTLQAADGSETSMNKVNIASLLSGLRALTTLSMTNVNVNELPISFAGTTSLTDLALVRTAIATVNPQAFTNASNLRSLDLSFNSFAGTGGSMSWLGAAVSLEAATVTDCGVTAAYLGQMPSLPRLKKLDLSRNAIDRLESNSLANVAATLEELVLNSNSISETNTAGLLGLTALKKLSMLSDTQLGAIPPQVKQLQRLEQLDLRGTNVAGVEADSFHPTSSLRVLKLDYAPVHSVHALAFARASQLEEFTLAVGSLSTTSILDTAGRLFPGNWSIITAQVPQLQVLTLSGADAGAAGGLTDTIWTSLQPLSRLRRLTLDYNSVTGPPDFYLASAFVNLTYLSLASNSIARVTSAGLYGAGGVQLQLQNNRIAAMDNCTLAMYTNLTRVNLAGNPFACTCALQWLWLRLKTDSPLSLPGMQCSQPAALAGRTWSSLAASDFCSSGEVPPNNCSVLTPPTVLPTTTVFPYQLSITVSKVDDSHVRMEASVASLEAHFTGYSVKYWPVSRPQALLNTSLLTMTTGSITLQVTPNELYRYCYDLVNTSSASWLVESPVNCRDFTLSGLPSAAVIAIAVLAAIIGVALIFVLVCLLCKRARRRQSAALKAAAAADEDPYTYTYPDEKQVGGSNGANQFQATLRPESKRFSKRSRPNLAGSRPSLATSTTTLATNRTSSPGFAVQNGARPSSGHAMMMQQQHHQNPQLLSGGRSLHSVADDPTTRQSQQQRHHQQMMSRSQDHLSSGPPPHHQQQQQPQSQRNSGGGSGRMLPAPPRQAHSQELVLDVTRVPAGSGRYQQPPPPLPPGRQHQSHHQPHNRNTVMTIDYDNGAGGGRDTDGYVPMSSTAVLSYQDAGESSTEQQHHRQQSPGYNYNDYLPDDQLPIEAAATTQNAQQRLPLGGGGGVENSGFQRNEASGYYEMGHF